MSHALLRRNRLFYMRLYFAQISEPHSLQRIEIRCHLDQRLVLCYVFGDTQYRLSVCVCTEAGVPRSQEM